MDNKKLFIRRLYAALIDIIIVTIIYYFMNYLYLSTLSSKDTISYTGFMAEFNVYFVLFLFVYFMGCEVFGQSVGKQIMGIKIVKGKHRILSSVMRPFMKTIFFYLPILVVVSFFISDYALIYDKIFKDRPEMIKIERKDLRG